MSDRADYLARTLVTRLERLRASFAEDQRGEPDRAARRAMLEKVLAVELGLTDGATLSLVESALPAASAHPHARDRELAALARFLRERLKSALAE